VPPALGRLAGSCQVGIELLKQLVGVVEALNNLGKLGLMVPQLLGDLTRLDVTVPRPVQRHPGRVR
jgi:hypothetical protein